MQKALAYMRVSIKDEDVNNQRIAIWEFAQKNNYEIVKEFEDINTSGWKIPILKRSKFLELLDYAEKEGIKTILIYDVTRFGRNWKDVTATYLMLDDQGYNIIFVLQPFLNKQFYEKIYNNVREPLRTFLIESKIYDDILMLSRSAEFESVMISMRTQDGMVKAKREGARIGRPKLSEEIRDRIIELFEKGYTYEEIRDQILREGKYLDKEGKPKAPGKATISKVINEYFGGS